MFVGVGSMVIIKVKITSNQINVAREFGTIGVYSRRKLSTSELSDKINPVTLKFGNRIDLAKQLQSDTIDLITLKLSDMIDLVTLKLGDRIDLFTLKVE